MKKRQRIVSGRIEERGTTALPPFKGLGANANRASEGRLKNARLRDGGIPDAPMRNACIRDACIRNACVRDALARVDLLREIRLRRPCVRDACIRIACVRDARVKEACFPRARLRIHRGRDIRRFEKLGGKNGSALLILGLTMGCALLSPAFGVTVAELQEPINNLKDTIFGGWMMVPKIGAAVGGCLMGVYNQSIVPLATGAGIGLGIHFYELYLSKGVAALI